MANVIQAIKWFKDGKTVYRKQESDVILYGEDYKGELHFIHLCVVDLLAEDWEVYEDTV